MQSNKNAERDMLAQRNAWAIRDQLAHLARDANYDMMRVSRETGVPYRTVNRYLTIDGKDKEVPPLPFVIQLLRLMAQDPRVHEVSSVGEFFDRALQKFD